MALLHQTTHAASIALDWQHIAGGPGKEAGGLYIQESWSESKAEPEGRPYTVIYGYTQELLYTVTPCYTRLYPGARGREEAYRSKQQAGQS